MYRASPRVPDFTVIARRTLDTALTRMTAPRPSRPAASGTSSRATVVKEGELVRARVEGAPFRIASQRAGFHRAEAKRAFKRVALHCADLHHARLRSTILTELLHTAAWAFAAKDTSGRPGRLNRLDESSIWTHVWVDSRNGLVAGWVSGPPSLSSRGAVHDQPSLTSAIELGTAWLAAREPGLQRKVRTHDLAISLLLTAHNFCCIGTDGTTPAMRAGWTTRPWRPEELLAVSPALEERAHA
jgi:hypothetical protein